MSPSSASNASNGVIVPTERPFRLSRNNRGNGPCGHPTGEKVSPCLPTPSERSCAVVYQGIFCVESVTQETPVGDSTERSNANCPTRPTETVRLSDGGPT